MLGPFRINLDSSQTTPRQIIEAYYEDGDTFGPVTIRVVSSGRPVIIDGFRTTGMDE